ncbi:SPFH domain-containing protein [Streptomyces sp. PCS3-D2]|uniref:SPFH domain-containing protein n=1 Tax=Streptomyces sp. PCS3-D2 TaxID=1460244 RepID=UPI00044A3289|nr:SPFH domain-containing protein [Streptomyces sp. PCS3-D2]WKV73794.1 SPFH domain-containing protein [Streptomyces sp. PCS3-D2]
MFPTRTTSTTGTLRLPAAPEPAPTSFGWAATTPTLSLRAAPPPAAERAPSHTGDGPAAPPATGSVPPPAGEAVPGPVPVPAAASGAVSAEPPGESWPAPAASAAPVPTPSGPGEPWPVPVGHGSTAVPARPSVSAPAGSASSGPAPAAVAWPAVAPHGVPVPAGQAPPRAAEPSAVSARQPGPAAQTPQTPDGCGSAAVPGAVLAGVPAAQAPRAVPLGTYAVPPAVEQPVGPAPETASEPPAVPAPAGEAEPLAARAPHASSSQPAPRPADRVSGPLLPAPAAAPLAHGETAGVDDGSGRVPAPGPQAAEAAEAAARGRAEPEHTRAGSEGGRPDAGVPHPQCGEREESGAAPNSGVPGPGVAEIVARAVTRAMEEDSARDLPNAAAPHRGTAVTEVPLHLPFRAASTGLLPQRAPAAVARPVRPAPGRRVPRGDDQLREHRGPVLPGWVGVAVGGLALVGCTAVLWRAGAVPDAFAAAFGAAPRAYRGLRAADWPPLAFLGVVALVALGGLGRARTGHAWVLTLFGRYRGTVRRTGLTWVSPLLLRRRVDVRLRHWRSDPMPAVDSGGLALQVVVQVVWQVKDTARATLAVADHTGYLAEQVESAMARVLSQLPADAFHEDAPTLRDAEAVGDALTRMLAAETEAVGIEVFSAQPTRIEYAAEVAEAMRRRRVAAIDAKHRDTVLASVVDAVDDTVHRLTSRGLVELDDYERKALVKDLTVAFCTGRAD